MIPLVVGKREFDYVRARIDAVAEAVQQNAVSNCLISLAP